MMKILMITPYVTVGGYPEFERNKTGFGYMVMDIARAIGKLEDVNVLAINTRGAEFVHDGVRFLKRSLAIYLLRLYYCLPFSILIDLRNKYPMSNGSLFRLMYCWLMSGYLCKVLKTGHYDMVHIHGCGFATELWMDVCKRCGQKFVVTLHGLNSFSDTVKLETAGKTYERVFLDRVVKAEFPVTVISTGMKRLIEKTYEVGNCGNINVVCNSFSFDKLQNESNEVDIRSLHGLKPDVKVVVCVGNICKRKNQGQIIRAFNYLQDELAENTYVLFIGNCLDENYTINGFLDNSRWASHFVVCGIIPKEMISNYYEQCDGVVLMSISEGFGLSLIEGMHFGKPCVSFIDVDAYEDIFHPDVMVGVKEHTDMAVAEGLQTLLTRIWDSETIREYSKRFESGTMANNYRDVYKKLLE